MGIKENWWRLNYHLIRLAAVPVAKQVLRIKVTSENEVPVTRPIFLAPLHRTSADMYVIANVTGELICYVSTDQFGHNRVVNFAQKCLTRALGSVIWQEKGTANVRRRAVALARDVEDRLDRRLIVAAFTQGEYQPFSVESVEDSLIGLLRRYEVKRLREKGHELRIPIVPVGIEYSHDGRGLELSSFVRWLASHVPYFPTWVIPAIGTHITVRFGEPRYFDGRTAAEVTDLVMREAAALSKIPYNA
jgi:1-acyl-sn-glycerol-3-phosphate acyltransferase